MSLTAKDIEEITRLLEDSSFDELDLELHGMKLHLRRRGNGDIPHFLANGDRPAEPAAPNGPSIGEVTPVAAHLSPVRAPLLGTFYRAPKPGAPPFIEEGSAVEPDTIIGIIEVMKLMTTVRAGVRGVVTGIRARDGVLVEYGEVLLTVDEKA